MPRFAPRQAGRRSRAGWCSARPKAFDFLDAEGIKVDVLGPIVEQVNGRDALPWLSDASHTITGHSIVLKMTFGNVRFLFGADIDTPSEERLLAKAAEIGASLTAEVLKVPHHGSADFVPGCSRR